MHNWVIMGGLVEGDLTSDMTCYWLSTALLT